MIAIIENYWQASSFMSWQAFHLLFWQKSEWKQIQSLSYGSPDWKWIDSVNIISWKFNDVLTLTLLYIQGQMWLQYVSRRQVQCRVENSSKDGKLSTRFYKIGRIFTAKNNFHCKFIQLHSMLFCNKQTTK